jgi:hypothetical protein
MIIEQPTTLSDAAKILAAKNLLPTSLDTAGLRQLDAALRTQSLFSAETTDQYLLQLYRDRIGGILNPQAAAGEATTQFNPAYVRQSIKQFLQEIGYAPAPENAGTLKDLASDPRINLVIKTNAELVQGQGLWIANQNPVILDEWPAQELFRAESRKVPRDWLERWRLAGAQTSDPIGTGWTITADGRLIALKNHDIWNWIGSSDLFADALDVIWPPFAFGSGMWVRDVDRAETESIGLLDKGEAAPEPMAIGDALDAFMQKISALAKEALA